MSSRNKNILYSIVLILAVIVVHQYRQRNKILDPYKIEGTTMGTTYHITYFDTQNRDFKPSVDSILQVFNQSVNTYLKDSEITTFNKAQSGIAFGLPYFFPVVDKASKIAEQSAGAFDPTVMPLVNAWGFGPAQPMQPDSTQVDSILQFVGMKHILFDKDSVWKDDPRTQLDFSAIAKGYGVDVVADFLRSKGIVDQFVEIGGEVMAYGKNRKTQEPWVIGLLNPKSTIDNQYFIATIGLSDKAIATSGNYFNYRESNGKRYSHTIDPMTGYPAMREILSASIVAKDCMTADAWATACMVMGHDKAIQILEQHSEIEAFLIYSGENGELETYTTPSLLALISFESE